MKKSILFVDDERKVLEGLQRSLRGMRHEWEMVFVGSGAEALEVLNRMPVDVVVTDVRMPCMDGCRLLSLIRESHPRVVRIVLSGYSEQEVVMKSVRVAHQYLSKPCDPEMLKATLVRAFGLRELLSDERLLQLISRIETLPSAPAIYQEVLLELSCPQTSIARIAEVMSRDIAMTAKILHIANSAFFGFSHHVNNLDRALTLLGLDTVGALVLSMHIFSLHDRSNLPGLNIQYLWDHCMKTASIARVVARRESREKSIIEDSFMGGLLHDVGRLVLAESLPEACAEAVQRATAEVRPLADVERELLGTTHAEVGAYLMGLWGLPDPIVEAIAYHHLPGKCLGRGFSPLTAIHVANALAGGDHRGRGANLVDADYLGRLDLLERLPAWKAAAEELMAQGGGDA